MFFFFNTTATTEIYTLSLHDALPILKVRKEEFLLNALKEKINLQKLNNLQALLTEGYKNNHKENRSEEHTSELQSRLHLVCRLLLEKKKIDMPKPIRLPSLSHDCSQP